MKDVMEYKGYVGSVRYNAEDGVLYGRLEGIRDLITYEATDVNGLRQAFQEAVDDYLDDCDAAGRPADQPFKGSFNVRTGSDLHKRVAVFAGNKEKSLNSVVVEALEFYLAAIDRDRQPAVSRVSGYGAVRYINPNLALHAAAIRHHQWIETTQLGPFVAAVPGYTAAPEHYPPEREEEGAFSKLLQEQFCGAS